uniref:AN1-type domain-containing protein n=1 Tax=Parastrongyloides trichosuri TaxID=131310 RepID=A0A0N4ZMU8_PARTI
MAEFFDLGEHCGFSECRKLDFLPMKCDACSNCFCSDHIQYFGHQCKKGFAKDNQVPICPLCNKPVPVGKNEDINNIMNNHIENGCKEIRKKIYTNACNANRCKKKELVPIKCVKCNLNYCISHRFPNDHDCDNKIAGTKNTKTKGNEERRISSQRMCKNDSKNDETLARILQEILMENPNLTQEEIDQKLSERLTNINNHFEENRRPIRMNQNACGCHIQ